MTELDFDALRQGALAAHLWADAYNPDIDGVDIGGDESGEADATADEILAVPSDPALPYADADETRKLRQIADHAVEWAKANAADVAAFMAETSRDESQVGHDFALSRSGHGTGLWDRGASDALATRLHDTAKVFGPVTIEYHRDEHGELTELVVMEGA